jgi:hypothetical protein
MNIAEIEIQLAELVKQPFDQREFALRLLEIYNAPKATLTKLRTGTQNKGEQPGDVLWSRKLFFRVAGDRRAATTLDALRDTKATKSQKPRFLFTTDGSEVAAYDTKADETLHCEYDKLHDHFDFFLPLAGIEKYEAVAENPADIKAAGRLAKLHDEIERCNPDWLVPEKRHALNQFLTRILFCMFAEDTGSFPPDLFVKTISEFGGTDGEHLQSLLKQIFDAMNVAEDQRANLPAHIRAFPYVNGGLFADSTEVPAFNRRAKRLLVEAAQLDWREINPDIFGSMIQAVVDTEMRGDLGMHYTSVPNIMKVLQPLFLMSLEEEFDRARGHREERSLLRKLLTRVSKIRVFDPACGSGNFLIIAYRELRTLEMRVFQRLDEIGGGQTTWREQSGVKLSNFYGIELADFAAETTKLSLWIAEYQMNQRFKSLFGVAPKSFPLRDGGHINCANAMRLDWLEVCPLPTKQVQKEKIFDLARVEKVHASEEVIDEEAETFIVGNPPYLGGKIQSEEQKRDLREAFSGTGVNPKNLDYVAGWFIKASRYLRHCRQSEFAFVATNSLNQGIHAPILWPAIVNQGLQIQFAFRDIKWSNSAANAANVTCSIVGVSHASSGRPRYLFTETTRILATNINAYLLNCPNYVVEKRSEPLSDLPKMYHGNTALDDGQLMLTRDEKDSLLARHPSLSRVLKKVMGSREFINGIERWCLWIDDADLPEIGKIVELAARFEHIREFRSAGGVTAQSCADRPHQFFLRRLAKSSYLVVPAVSSERRTYLPAGFVDADTIITHLSYIVLDPPPFLLSIICSRLHLVWMQTMGGRLESRYRYSTGVVYNTFPLPRLSGEQRDVLEAHAWEMVAAREAHPGKTIAWLYDPETMPHNLLEAHRTVDDTLEKIYIGRPFKNDTERLEHLFKLYADMTSGTQKEVALA